MIDTEKFDLSNIDTRYLGSIRGLHTALTDIYSLANNRIAPVDNTGYILHEVAPVLQIALDAATRCLNAYERAQQIKDENFEPLFLKFDENGDPIQVTPEEYKQLNPSADDEEAVNLE